MRQALFWIEVTVLGGLVILGSGMMLVSGAKWLASLY